MFGGPFGVYMVGVRVIGNATKVGNALLVDQGDADQFLTDQLKPDLLRNACERAGIPIELRMRRGYDHSYYFISTFMADHIAWHGERLHRSL